MQRGTNNPKEAFRTEYGLIQEYTPPQVIESILLKKARMGCLGLSCHRYPASRSTAPETISQEPTYVGAAIIYLYSLHDFCIM